MHAVQVENAVQDEHGHASECKPHHSARTECNIEALPKSWALGADGGAQIAVDRHLHPNIPRKYGGAGATHKCRGGKSSLHHGVLPDADEA
jgi:hypothetical protein